MKKTFILLIFLSSLFLVRLLNIYAADGLVAAFSFDENSGTTATDISGNNNNGTVSGAVWNSSGKFGSALRFDGINDLVTVNDADSLDLTSGMTIEAWVNPAVVSGWRTIALKEKSTDHSYALYANNHLDRPDTEVSGVGIASGSTQLPTNTWSHLAGTFDGSTLKIYLNGSQVGSAALSGSISTSSNPLRIGGNAIWGEYFSGLIDEVRIYNRALSQAEIQSDMNTPINTSLPSLTPTPTGGVSPTTTITPTFTPTPTPNSTEAQFGKWESVMNWPIVAVHAVLMKNGKVLIWDGWEIPSYARVWDPANNTFSQFTNQDGLFCSGHSTLADGRILVAGGHAENGDGIRDTNIFNPNTNSWETAPNMSKLRWYPSVTSLQDGKAIVISGAGSASEPWADTPEIYNPATNSWTNLSGVNTGDIHDPMYPHPYVLPNGTLFVVSPTYGTSRRLNIGAKTWTSLPTSPVKFGTPVMYQPGKIMISGGGSEYGNSQKNTTVMDVNAGSPAWRNTAQMSYGRYHHNNVILPDGKVLAVGGAATVDKNSNAGPLPAEIWNPDTETWTTMASMANRRNYHSVALLMPDGRVLSAGGGRYGSATNYLNAQYYNPPYLYKGTRPVISSMSGSTVYNSSFTINTSNADSITTVSLLSLGSVTHTLDMNQRFMKLNFSKSGNSLNVSSPLNSNYAPPGYYMVFILNSSGVPSVAKIIQIVDATQPSPTISPTPTATPAPGTGLVAAYGFSENSGSVTNDATANNNNGVISGATWNSAGKFGSALNFDGVNDVINISDSNSLDLTSGMTLEAWINPTAITDWRTVILKERPGNHTYALYANNHLNRPDVEVYQAGFSSGISQVPLNTWTHLAGTYDGAVLKMYVNGNLVSSNSISGSITTSANQLRIGGNSIWGEYFAGRIDEVRIYNRALSQSEIQSDVITPVNSSPPTPTGGPTNTPTPTPTGTTNNLMAAYSFNQGSGTTLTDGSGNNNNGTVSGAVWNSGGKYGSALSFDGTDDRVNIGDSNSLDLTSGMTLEAWIKPAVISNWRTIILKEQSGNHVYGLYANNHLNRADVEVFGVGFTSGLTQIPLNTWTHVAGTYDGTALKMYINGNLASSINVSGPIRTSTGSLRIGGNAVWTNEYFSGLIDEIRIYNKALSAVEIQTDMNTPL